MSFRGYSGEILGIEEWGGEQLMKGDAFRHNGDDGVEDLE